MPLNVGQSRVNRRFDQTWNEKFPLYYRFDHSDREHGPSEMKNKMKRGQIAKHFAKI